MVVKRQCTGFLWVGIASFTGRARWVVALSIVITMPLARGANVYWSNDSGDSRWSNPVNWTRGAVPDADDAAVFGNHCLDKPQQIILDTNAWLSSISCTATGNRSFRITPQGDEFIRLNATYPLSGTSAAGVDLTIDAPILMGNSYLRVSRGGGATTLNASVGPSPEERESCYLIAHYDVPLTLAASNNLTQVQLTGNAHVVVKHPQALGHGYINCWGNSVRGLLTLQTNVTVGSYIRSGTPLHFRTAESDTADIYMDIIGNTWSGTLVVEPRGDGATGKFAIRVTDSGQTFLAKLWLEDYSSLVFSNTAGTAYLGSSNYTPDHGAISGQGSLIVEGGGTLLVASTNSYTGGTFIRKGTLTMYRDSCLPTNGAVWISTNATLSGYSGTRVHWIAELHGEGQLREGATFHITRSLNPGMNGPGKLNFNQAAKLVLEPEATSVFELGAPDGANDVVAMLHPWSHLTLDGKLRVVNLGALESGTYTLFDMAAKDMVTGEFSEIEMPAASTGRVEIDSSGKVVLHVKRQYGTSIYLR